MITFKIQGKTAMGRLNGQKFTVPDEPLMEGLLNQIALACPVLNGGSPDPDYDLFQNVVTEFPFLEIVTRDEMPPLVEGRVY